MDFEFNFVVGFLSLDWFSLSCGFWIKEISGVLGIGIGIEIVVDLVIFRELSLIDGGTKFERG